MTKPVTFLNLFQVNSSPFNLISPQYSKLLSIFILLASRFKRVDFPAPELPMMAKHSPLSA
jgi:hypothetical protein